MREGVARPLARNGLPNRSTPYRKRRSKYQLDWTSGGPRRWSHDMVCVSAHRRGSARSLYCLSFHFPALAGGQASRPRGMRAPPATGECARAGTASAIEWQCHFRNRDLWRALQCPPQYSSGAWAARGGHRPPNGLQRSVGTRSCADSRACARARPCAHAKRHRLLTEIRSDLTAAWCRRRRYKIASPFRSCDSNRQRALAADGRGVARPIANGLLTTFTRASATSPRPDE